MLTNNDLNKFLRENRAAIEVDGLFSVDMFKDVCALLGVGTVKLSGFSTKNKTFTYYSLVINGEPHMLRECHYNNEYRYYFIW